MDFLIDNFYEIYNYGIESYIVNLWNTYVADFGYYILFCWGILEGELGLIFAGIASHTGHMNVGMAIFVGGLGGFTGDQIYFYIGRLNKDFIQKKLKKHRRKLALAHLLMKKYGWPIIFFQRYMYGMRTIIPISIGLTRYSAIKFAFINLISAWIWAAITILLAWFLGEKILLLLVWFKEHPYIFIILLIIFLVGTYTYFKTQSKRIERKVIILENTINNSDNNSDKTQSNNIK